MSLTPEQIAKGWKLHDGSDVCPIKDERTVHQVMFRDGQERPSERDAHKWSWGQSSAYRIIAYRIIEAHGADAEPRAMRCAECDCEKGGADCNWIKSGPDAEPARPTPFPHDYSELVWDADGWSQTIIVDGKRPEWLRDDDRYAIFTLGDATWTGDDFDGECAIRVRRLEPKRETGECFLIVTARSPSLEFQGSIDLIDGKPDLSTLKIAEGAL